MMEHLLPSASSEAFASCTNQAVGLKYDTEKLGILISQRYIPFRIPPCICADIMAAQAILAQEELSALPLKSVAYKERPDILSITGTRTGGKPGCRVGPAERLAGR